MPLISSLEDVKDSDSLFLYMKESDLAAGETLEELVNPPRKNVVKHDDGSETWTSAVPPYNWKYTDDTKSEITKEAPLLVTVLTLGPLIRMGTITEDNWKDFWIRLRMYEKAFGSLYPTYPITPGMIQSLVGLRLNVHTEPLDVFRTLVGEWLQRDAEEDLVKTLEEKN